MGGPGSPWKPQMMADIGAWLEARLGVSPVYPYDLEVMVTMGHDWSQGLSLSLDHRVMKGMTTDEL